MSEENVEIVRRWLERTEAVQVARICGCVSRCCPYIAVASKGSRRWPRNAVRPPATNCVTD
jgi:hypothetical protein